MPSDRRDRSGAASRALAARVLDRVLREDLPLPEALAAEPGSAGDEGFVQELCYGTSRWYFAIEPLVRQRLRTPLKERDGDIQALLLIGVYQLGWMRLPQRAAVHATVAAAASLGKAWAGKLINAVLRGIQRDAGAAGVAAAARADADPDDLDLLPPWLTVRLRQAYPEQAAAIGAAYAARPPMTLRVSSADDRQHCIETLAAAGLEAHPGALSPQAIYLARPVPVTALPGFAEGRLSVQDEAAQLAAGLLAPVDGERILDACAAPGGKTGHLLELAPDAEVLALDVEPRRCTRIEANLERLQRSARVVCADVRDTEAWWDGDALDAILLDAPCSATGILRRQPDVRLLRAEDDVAILTALQRDMLEALWPLLRPGGRLLYCTCSVLPEENAALIEAFCAAHPDAHCLPIAASWGLQSPWGRQLLPTADAHDGFHFALLQRQATS